LPESDTGKGFRFHSLACCSLTAAALQLITSFTSVKCRGADNTVLLPRWVRPAQVEGVLMVKTHLTSCAHRCAELLPCGRRATALQLAKHINAILLNRRHGNTQAANGLEWPPAKLWHAPSAERHQAGKLKGTQGTPVTVQAVSDEPYQYPMNEQACTARFCDARAAQSAHCRSASCPKITSCTS
jgi:hypothetical protein